jgi:hypothetical protein
MNPEPHSLSPEAALCQLGVSLDSGLGKQSRNESLNFSKLPSVATGGVVWCAADGEGKKFAFLFFFNLS